MGKVLAAVALGVMLGRGVQAQVYTNVYVDNFDSFASGTVLTSNNFATAYLPQAGSNTMFTNDYVGSLTASVLTTNLYGSMGTYWNAQTNSSLYYDAFLNQPASNTTVRISWNWMLQSTNATAGGAFNLGLTSTNGSGGGKGTSGFLSFLDDGTINVFTNTPNPPVSFPVKVGNFSSGVLYTNQLDYNLLLDQYSLFVNGIQIVTNQAIPDYLNTNALTEFFFRYDTRSGKFTDGLTSSNQVFLDNVTVGIPEAIPEPGAVLPLGLGAVLFLWLRRRMVSEKRERSPLGLDR